MVFRIPRDVSKQVMILVSCKHTRAQAQTATNYST
jgi:hypothetical protein